MKKCLFIGLATLLSLVIFTPLAGCDDFHRIVGSNTLETRTFDYTGFNRIEVSNTFAVEVTQGATYQVTVTINDNLFNELDISMSGDTLRIRMKPFTSLVHTTLRAVVSMPVLKALTVSGASQATVSGFHSDNFLILEANGASHMDIKDVKAGDTNIQVSGASRLSGSLVTTDGDFETSGASTLELSGSGGTVRVNVSGASRAKLPNFVITDASVTVSGASNADIQANGTLDVELSGASTLTYGDSPKLGRVDVSGASTLKRR